MSGSDPRSDARGPELLEGGSEHDGWLGSSRPSVAAALRDIARRHRVAAVACMVVVALVAGGVVAARTLLLRPDLTTTTAVSGPVEARAYPLDLWLPDDEGRPAAPLSLQLPVALTDPAQSSQSPEAVATGLAGPGVMVSAASPQARLTATPLRVTITATIDCDAVPLPVDPSLYGIRVHLTQGDRTGEASMPLGGAASGLVENLGDGCSSWLAARDLTVTRVLTTVDPTLTRVDTILQVDNAGTRDALVWTPDPTGSGTQVTSLVVSVPGQDAITVRVRATMDVCEPYPSSRVVLGTETPLGLRGAAGLDFRPRATGQSVAKDFGLVFNAAASGQLRAALLAACGGIAGPGFSSPGVSSYDPRSGLLSVPLEVVLPPGRPMTVQLQAGDDPDSARPVPAASAWLTPDARGHVRTTMRFVASVNGSCSAAGPFLVMVLAARVPDGGAVRTPRFMMTTETTLRPEQFETLCR